MLSLTAKAEERTQEERGSIWGIKNRSVGMKKCKTECPDLSLCAEPCCCLYYRSQQCLLNILSHPKFSWKNQTLISKQPAKSHLMSSSSCSVSLAALQEQSRRPGDGPGDGEAGAGMVNKEEGWTQFSTVSILFTTLDFSGFLLVYVQKILNNQLKQWVKSE